MVTKNPSVNPYYAAQHRISIASVDAQATKGDEAWTEQEEKELLLLVNDEAYRKVGADRVELSIYDVGHSLLGNDPI